MDTTWTLHVAYLDHARGIDVEKDGVLPQHPPQHGRAHRVREAPSHFLCEGARCEVREDAESKLGVRLSEDLIVSSKQPVEVVSSK